jgi:hypothetical protein
MIHHLGTIHRHGEEGLLPSLVCHGPTTLVGHIALGMTSGSHAVPDIIADVALTFGFLAKRVAYISWLQAGSLAPLPPGEVSLAHHGARCPDTLPECRRRGLEVLR